MFVYILVETIFCRWEVLALLHLPSADIREMLALLPSEAASTSTRSSLAVVATTDPWLICHFLSNL